MKSKSLIYLLLCGATPLMLVGCGEKQTPLTAAPPPPPTVALTEQDKQLIDSFKNLPPRQQQEFLKKNPKLAQNPLVIAQMREATLNKK